MKIKSIEEKAKRYDEAIEIARQIHDADRVSGIELTTCEEIFPELKESEDERIRKEILDFCKNRAEKYPNDPKYKNISTWIAWLEKQGAKVSAIEGFDTEFEKQVSYLIASAINKEHEYNQGYVKWIANALLNYAKHELEKQGEQGSAWSQEDENIFENLIELIEQSNDEKEGFVKFRNRLKSLGLQNRCKSSAWSEEDEKYTNIVLAALYRPSAEDLYSFHKVKSSDVTNWFNSLKDRVQPQPKQEWSKEDERNLNIVSSVINNPSVQGIYDYHKVNPTDVSNWLKERIRQHKQWKPSDEQLKALNTMNVTGCITEVGQGKSLVELYNDLKKLREK